jgi:hypothetical protein
MAAALISRVKKAEEERFGSRAWARKLAERAGPATPSARLRHIDAGLATAAPQMRQESRRAGRHRILPCQLWLALGAGSLELFPAGPFDEFRCSQRQVRSRHSFEYLTYLAANEVASEGYRPFARFDLRGAPTPLPRLSRALGFWKRLHADYGVRAIPRPRLTQGGRREGRVQIAAGLGSGVFRRPGQPGLPYAALLDMLRELCTGPEWIAWLESAFPAPAPGEVWHRYYLDADLQAYLVRDEGARGKRLLKATLSAERPGLLVYPWTLIA